MYCSTMWCEKFSEHFVINFYLEKIRPFLLICPENHGVISSVHNIVENLLDVAVQLPGRHTD